MIHSWEIALKSQIFNIFFKKAPVFKGSGLRLVKCHESFVFQIERKLLKSRKLIVSHPTKTLKCNCGVVFLTHFMNNQRAYSINTIVKTSNYLYHRAGSNAKTVKQPCMDFEITLLYILFKEFPKNFLINRIKYYINQQVIYDTFNAFLCDSSK